MRRPQSVDCYPYTVMALSFSSLLRRPTVLLLFARHPAPYSISFALNLISSFHLEPSLVAGGLRLWVNRYLVITLIDFNIRDTNTCNLPCHAWHYWLALNCS